MSDSKTHHIVMFVAGAGDTTAQLLTAVRKTLEARLKDDFSLDVIDVLERPERANEERILVTPTLIFKLPAPERRLFGDLTDAERIHLILDLGAGD